MPLVLFSSSLDDDNLLVVLVSDVHAVNLYYTISDRESSGLGW